MNIEKTLLYTTAAMIGIAVYLNSPGGSLSYVTPLMMIGMAARRRDDEEPQFAAPGKFIRSTKLSSLMKVVRNEPGTAEVQWQVPAKAQLPESKLRETATADLPTWTPQEITTHENNLVQKSAPETQTTSSPKTPSSTDKHASTTGMKIKKTASLLWREPSREPWINAAILAKKSNSKTGGGGSAKSDYVQWRASEEETKTPPVFSPTSLNDEDFEQHLTFERAQAAAASANEQAKAAQKLASNQCAVNIPALAQKSKAPVSAPAGQNSVPSSLVSRQPQPYAIDWTQSSNEQKDLPKMKSLNSIIPPHQPKMDNPFDAIEMKPAPAKATAAGAENSAIVKSFPSKGQAQSLPLQSIQSQGFQSQTFAARTTAAQTLSLPAQDRQECEASSPKSNSFALKPTGGAFARTGATDMTSTIPLDMEVQVYEEPLHPNTPTNPEASGFTKRGLPNSMVTTQQLKTIPAGNRRAEEYKKALKSNLALQRKCQALVERLVQERTAKLELLNHELQIARDKAVEMSNLKSQFVANVSHELRTPLAGILGMSELLKDMGLSSDQSEVAEHIFNSATALMTTVSDLLDFSKLETGKLELSPAATSVREVVNRVIATVSPLAKEKGITINAAIDPTIPEPIFGDPERIEQVLSNFVMNAVKFTEHGGIRIEATVDDRNGEWVVVRFAVADTGIGISESNIRKLFNPFVQADGSHTRKYGGTGLGLSISKRLVTLMSGGIGVSSVEGQGSTFAFTIPFQMHMPNLMLMPVEKQRAEERAS